MKYSSILRKNKFKIIGYTFLFSFIIFCESCFTMRHSNKETRQSFELANMEYTDTTAVINNQQIHYIQTGKQDKELLVFVHGSPGSWNAFERYIQDSLLLERYQMISVDRPGFGFSDYRDAKNLEDQAKTLNAFLKQIKKNNQSVTLIGHSYGSPLIAKMAVLDSLAYENLVILAGALDPKAEKPEKWRPVIASFPLKYLVPGALRTSNKELIWLKDDLYILDKELDKITSNIYIVHGTLDELVPFENVKYMETKFINAKKLQTDAIDSANHFIPWRHYGRIRDSLLKL